MFHRTYKCLFVLSGLAIANLLIFIYLRKPSVLHKNTFNTLGQADRASRKILPNLPAALNQASNVLQQNCSRLASGDLLCKNTYNNVNDTSRKTIFSINSLLNSQSNSNNNSNNSKVVQQAANRPEAGVKETVGEKKHVFPHDFELVINHPDKCKDASNPVYLLVFINTIHKNFDKRKAIRDTWASVKSVKGKRVLSLFTLAQQHDDKLQELVVKENQQYGDLLMEDFHDSYKNLTYKSVMGFKWAKNFCPGAKYVMKTDDDMFIHYENLVKYLESAPDSKFAAGYVINGSPIRDKRSKWYMPKELYPDSRYPPFMSGTGYVMSGEVAHAVYVQSLDTPFLYLEDVFVGICLKAIGVVPKKQPDFHNWKTGYSLCRYRKIISSHMLPPMELYRIWRDMQAKKSVRC